MQPTTPDTPYAFFAGELADKFALAPVEATALVHSLRAAPQHAPADPTDPLDHEELLLAVLLNAQIHSAQNDTRFKKLKFLLRNNNNRAINIATQWVEHKVSFEAMLAAV